LASESWQTLEKLFPKEPSYTKNFVLQPAQDNRNPTTFIKISIHLLLNEKQVISLVTAYTSLLTTTNTHQQRIITFFGWCLHCKSIPTLVAGLPLPISPAWTERDFFKHTSVLLRHCSFFHYFTLSP
jgi:hypothetical protein